MKVRDYRKVRAATSKQRGGSRGHASVKTTQLYIRRP